MVLKVDGLRPPLFKTQLDDFRFFSKSPKKPLILIGLNFKSEEAAMML